MSEYHCPYKHPRLQGSCNALLFLGDFQGEIEIKCWRCGRFVVFDRRQVLTASSAAV